MTIRYIDLVKDKQTSYENIGSTFPFKTFRPYQKEAFFTILQAFRDGYNYVLLEAPTGFGKSPLSIGLANYFGSAYILSSTKYLQNQYLRDFDTTTVKGRNNFYCLLKPKRKADTADCTLKGIECMHRPKGNIRDSYRRDVAKSAKRGTLSIRHGIEICPYWKQKCEAMNKKSVVFNYDYFLNETTYVGDFGQREVLIADETHNIENKLMNFIGMKISAYELGLIKETLPSKDIPLEEWKGMIASWREKLEKKVKEYSERIESLSVIETERLVEMAKKVKKMDSLLKEIGEDMENWVSNLNIIKDGERPTGWVEFKPIVVKKWSHYIFDKAKHFLLMSATILDPETICSSLNLKGKTMYIKVPSIFPIEQRRFLVDTVGRMSYKSKRETFPLLIDKVKEIMAENTREKGVIHTHSYDIQREILNNIRDMRMIFNPPNGNTDSVFREFISSGEPKILVTPSAYEGVDFKGDICRWQVLCKVPYPDLKDPQIRKRMKKDKKWYQWLTAVRLIQTYGRGTRSKDDFCKTYILDSDFIAFYRRNEKMLPEWFKEAVIFL